jgi:ABC-type xylose transport system substrate-binding protein
VRIHAHTAAFAAATVAAAVLLSACGGGDGGDSGGGRDGFTVGILLPAGGAGRFGQFDRPLIEQRLEQQCPDCRVETASARDDPATQRQQIDAMITEGVEVMILVAVDAQAARSAVSEADQAGIPVVAYDRLAEGPISGYVTFDGAQVGRLQGEALLKAVGDRARGDQIVMMNGAVTDPNSGWFERGALSVLKGNVKIGRSYDTIDWQQANAYANTNSAIAALGPDGIDGVLAANDNLATGVISALKAARISPLPPVTGQDADLAAVKRIVAGEQYMTVYKPFKPEAHTAADMAVALGRGQSLNAIADTTVDNSTDKDIPAVLLTPVSVTAGNIKDTLVKDGMYTVGEICTPDLRPACAKAGLTR